MDQSDEELIRKFAGLQTQSQQVGTAISIPNQAINSRNWDLCFLAKVHSDKIVFEAPFERQMRRAWGLNHTTTFTMIERGLYLLECDNEQERSKVLMDGPWTYRQDLVIVSECNSMEESDGRNMTHTDLWVQYHNIPLDVLNEEGIKLLTNPIGSPLSEPVPGFSNGKPYFKIRMLIHLSVPIKDKLTTTNPLLGETEVFLVYEKVGRICTYCGEIGHDITSCAPRARLAKIRSKLAGQNRPELEGILKPTRGPWIIDQTLIPIAKTGKGPKSAQEERPTTEPSYATEPTSKPKHNPVTGLKRPISDLTRNDLNPKTLLLTGELSSSLPNQNNAHAEEERERNVSQRRFKAARHSAVAGEPPSQI